MSWQQMPTTSCRNYRWTRTALQTRCVRQKTERVRTRVFETGTPSMPCQEVRASFILCPLSCLDRRCSVGGYRGIDDARIDDDQSELRATAIHPTKQVFRLCDSQTVQLTGRWPRLYVLRMSSQASTATRCLHNASCVEGLNVEHYCGGLCCERAAVSSRERTSGNLLEHTNGTTQAVQRIRSASRNANS
jgi:hypothetical protein